MYSFIFYFIYISSIWKYGQKGARIAGASMVIFAMLFHLFLAFLCVEKIYFLINNGNELIRQSDSPQNGISKLVFMALGILILIFGILYFSERRVSIIKEKYSDANKKEFIKPDNVIKFIILVFAPIVLVIVLG